MFIFATLLMIAIVLFGVYSSLASWQLLFKLSIAVPALIGVAYFSYAPPLTESDFADYRKALTFNISSEIPTVGRTCEI